MRKLLVAATGLIGLAVAFVLGQQFSRERAQPPPAPAAAAVAAAPAPAAQPRAAPAAPAAPAPPPVASLASPPAAPALPQASPPPAAPRAAPAAPAAPSFDHVRVTARGEMVVAGRAEPDTEVTILLGQQTLGVVRTDMRGEFVFVPPRPVSLAGSGTELSLRARGRDGTVTESAGTVLVLAPQQPPAAPPPSPPPTAPAQQAAAAPPAPADPPPPAAAPTIVELPRTAEALPRVLQAPSEPPAAPAQAAAAAPPPPPAVAAAAAPAPPMPGPAPGQAAPPARGPVSLQVVDYDQRGEVRFAGTAAPNAPVRVYVNNNPVGDAVAGSDGRWTLTPVAPVSPGVHQLRIDQLLPSGQVAGRVEAPFQRVEIPPESLRDGQVVVQPGQSLWRIARGAYGRGVRYTVIYQANREQIRDPAKIYPGQVFNLPTATN